MAGKFGKFLAFTTVAAAACAAVYYVLGNKKDEEYDPDENGAGDIFEKTDNREYVSLNTENIKETAEELKDKAEKTKEVLKEKITEATAEMKEKAKEAAEGVGLVKDEDKSAEDFEFDDFTTEEEEG